MTRPHVRLVLLVLLLGFGACGRDSDGPPAPAPHEIIGRDVACPLVAPVPVDSVILARCPWLNPKRGTP